MLPKRHSETHFGIMLRSFYQRIVRLRPLTIAVQILRYGKFYAIYLKSVVLLYFAYHIAQVKMPIMPF